MLQMIFHSKPIAIVLLIDMVALLMYNFSGMCVTGETMHCISPHCYLQSRVDDASNAISLQADRYTLTRSAAPIYTHTALV